MSDKLENGSAMDYFIQVAKAPIMSCYEYFSKNQQKKAIGNDGYIPEITADLGKILSFVLQSLDAYFGSNVFHV